MCWAAQVGGEARLPFEVDLLVMVREEMMVLVVAVVLVVLVMVMVLAVECVVVVVAQGVPEQVLVL
jgi:hypothetical protein